MSQGNCLAVNPPGLSVAPSSGLPGCLFTLATCALLVRALIAVSLLAGGRPVGEVAVHVVDGLLIAGFRGDDS